MRSHGTHPWYRKAVISLLKWIRGKPANDPGSGPLIRAGLILATLAAIFIGTPFAWNIGTHVLFSSEYAVKLADVPQFEQYGALLCHLLPPD